MASLALIFAFDGASYGLYSTTFLTGSDPILTDNTGSADEAEDDRAPSAQYEGGNPPDPGAESNDYALGSLSSDYPVPDYTVLGSSAGNDYGIPNMSVNVTVDSLYEDDLRAIAEVVAARAEGYDLVTIFVYEERLKPYDYDPNVPGDVRSSLDESTLPPSATTVVEADRERYRITRLYDPQ